MSLHSSEGHRLRRVSHCWLQRLSLRCYQQLLLPSFPPPSVVIGGQLRNPSDQCFDAPPVSKVGCAVMTDNRSTAWLLGAGRAAPFSREASTASASVDFSGSGVSSSGKSPQFKTYQCTIRAKWAHAGSTLAVNALRRFVARGPAQAPRRMFDCRTFVFQVITEVCTTVAAVCCDRASRLLYTACGVVQALFSARCFLCPYLFNECTLVKVHPRWGRASWE